MDTTRLNDAVVFGTLDDAFLARPITLAFGGHRDDKFWKNTVGSIGQLLGDLSKFEMGGSKDGRCLLQGEVVSADGGKGVPRTWKNMRANHLMMFDFDVGIPIDVIANSVLDRGLFTVLWTTWSHLKAETLIPQEKMTAHMRRAGMPDTQPVEADVIEYLRSTARLAPEVLAGATLAAVEHVEGGIKYRVRHQPCPRVRALFVLKDPFVFAERGGTQKAAAEEWKAYYAAVSETLGLPYDKSCVDPSRLMFTPRIPAGSVKAEGQHEILILAGDALDLAAVEITRSAKPSGERATARLGGGGEQNAFTLAAATAGEGTTRKFETPNLMRFLKEAGHDFEAMDWLLAMGEEPRHTHAGGGGMDAVCPNADNHTTGDDTDRAFMVLNASYAGDKKSGDGFTMSCRHEGCALASGGDRAWYLDQFCIEHGVTDAMDLITSDWCPNVWEAREKARQRASEAAKLAGDAAALDAKIAAVTADTSLEELMPILEALAAMPADKRLVSDDALVRLAKNSKRSLTVLRKERDRIERAAASAAVKDATADPEPKFQQRPVPEDLGSVSKVWLPPHWPWTDTETAVHKRLERLNTKAPWLFSRAEGGAVRVTKHVSGRLIVTVMKQAQWAAEISTQVRFCTATDGVEVEVQPPAMLKENMAGIVEKLNLPVLDRVLHVPVFAPNGELQWTAGYCPALQCYMDPQIEFLPVPDEITDEVLDGAVNLLMEAVCDFPFSDAFGEAEKEPVKVGEPDDQGYRQPNWRRGESSRANALAMILQPFARNLIGSPCPGYHIDKASPGTGAGYLADVMHIITTGATSPVQPMSKDNDEFRKAITSRLRTGATSIFIDNINFKVDNGYLAAALTAGKWTDRIIMSSDMTEIDMKALWMFAGNNLSFSDEMTRRLVPIRMNAVTPNPAQDRRPEEFLHYPLHDWLFANRAALVQACHIIISHWVRQGMKWGKGSMGSFDHYAGVMSGILEAAGVPGFLANVRDYVNATNDDLDTQTEFAQALYDEYGLAKMTLEDMLAVAERPDGAEGGLAVPVAESKDKHTKISAIGGWVKQNMMGRTYSLTLKPEVIGPHHLKAEIKGVNPGFIPHVKVELVRSKPHGKTKYGFEVVN